MSTSIQICDFPQSRNCCHKKTQSVQSESEISTVLCYKLMLKHTPFISIYTRLKEKSLFAHKVFQSAGATASQCDPSTYYRGFIYPDPNPLWDRTNRY